MACQRTNRKNMIANLKEKMIENEKCQWVTLYISNGGQSAINEISMYNLTTVQL